MRYIGALLVFLFGIPYIVVGLILLWLLLIQHAGAPAWIAASIWCIPGYLFIRKLERY
jgi:hypothetical protein